MPRKPKIPASRHADMDRMAYLVDALRQFEATARRAEVRGAFGPAVNAKKEATRIREEIDQLRGTEARAAMPRSRADHKAEILAEVRRLRQAATGIAAVQLMKLESDLLAAEAEEQAQAAERSLKEATADELRAEAERLLAETSPGKTRIVQ